MCPGARIAGLGGPCGRINRTNMRKIAIEALTKMRRVIWRLAMLETEVATLPESGYVAMAAWRPTRGICSNSEGSRSKGGLK